MKKLACNKLFPGSQNMQFDRPDYTGPDRVIGKTIDIVTCVTIPDRRFT